MAKKNNNGGLGFWGMVGAVLLALFIFSVIGQIMPKRKNIIIISVTIVIYLINQAIKEQIPIEIVRWFMSCDFNDTIGGMTFMAYCNIVFSFYHRKMVKLWQIELLMLFCGIFWEYITPLYRKNTISDVWDVLSYMIGGFLYWLIIKKTRNSKN